jgi:hypothetical protein
MAGAPADIHTEATRLADDLRSAGHDDEAERLDVAIAGGSTGTEILFCLRAELSSMGRRRSGLDRDWRKRARSLTRTIDRHLKSV